MSSSKPTRRNFIASSSVALLATRLPGDAAETKPADDTSKLAKMGGTKAVQAKPGKWVRWDDRERQQLSATVDQPSNFLLAGQGREQTDRALHRAVQTVLPE